MTAFRDIIFASFVAIFACGLIVFNSLNVYKTLTEAYTNNTAVLLERNEIERSLQQDVKNLKSEIEEQKTKRENLEKKTKNVDKTLQQDVTNLKSEIEELKTKKENLEKQIKNAEYAVTFIRWGRKDCPGNADLVYSGYAGGSHHTHKGAAAESVCLPTDPSWGPHANRPTSNAGLMYGTEYEDEVIFSVPDKTRDMPCALCRKSVYSTQVMIPARTTCYPGWDEAYRGYLAAGYYNHAAATQYVCVDENPLVVVHGGNGRNDDDKVIYPVKAKCGSLKCPPYINDAILSCVVCVK